MMVRGVLKEPVAFRSFVRALAPFLAAQWLLLLLVLLFPQLTPHGTIFGQRLADSLGTPVG
jgi:TRAP-type C4-dicarboxylate transport system permease large subunit